MFIDKSIPDEFNKIAFFGDNYIVLTNSSTIFNNRSYEVYIQYFYPSVYILHIDDYMFPLSTYHNLAFTYDSGDNLFSSEVLSFDTYSIDDSYGSSIGYRADFPIIFAISFILCLVFTWVFNQLSKFYKKGGIFY